MSASSAHAQPCRRPARPRSVPAAGLLAAASGAGGAPAGAAAAASLALAALAWAAWLLAVKSLRRLGESLKEVMQPLSRSQG